jgi:REP element-mobilizing transposase RayT
MAIARRTLVDPAEIGVFHCISRCVRRAFLCGRDSYSGKNYEHRRAWIRDRLRELAGLFAVEVHAYNVMSNHLHVVMRTRPDQAKAWDDAEVARRWLQICPGKRILSDPAGAPDECAIRALCADAGKLAVRRARLADLSWFMRCLNEPIARRANKEDECTGRFWEGRFKCQKLDDEGAALSCMAYVDLNPVRAGIAATPEQSEFTSACDRATAHKARRQLARAPKDPTPEQAPLIARAEIESSLDHWLAPIGALSGEQVEDPQESDQAARAHPVHGVHPAAKPGTGTTPPLLAHLSVEHYLELLDWTGRQIRSDKRGHIANELRPVLERLDLDVDAWVANVAAYGGLFHRIAGKLDRLDELAHAAGRAWLQGHYGARRLYVKAA